MHRKTKIVHFAQNLTHSVFMLNTKQEIITAAGRLFSKLGYAKTSIDEIAHYAHRAKRSVYNHFPDKESILKAVIEQEIEAYQLELTSILENSSDIRGLAKLRLYILKRMELMNKAVNISGAIRADIAGEWDSNKINFVNTVRSKLDAWEKKQFIQIIKDGITNKECSINIKPENFADILLMVLKGLEIEFFVKNSYDKYVDTFQLLTNYIVNSIISRNFSKTVQ